jgi:eukaryotic-like serine/threonine-protein kinase
MNVLLVDESKRRMQIMRRFLAKAMPDIAVTEYDVDQRGPPPHAFDWSEYDVALLNVELGTGGTGIEWLEKYRSAPNFPPAILVANQLDAKLMSSALQAGASTILPQRDLTPELLGDAVRTALSTPRATPAGNSPTSTLDGGRSGSDVEVVAQILREKNDVGGAGYRFIRLIGQGAMSRVYLAERMHDNLTVVLKLLDGTLASDEESIQRLIREASLVSGIDSPYVVKIFEQGFTNKYGFIAMEFFAKGDLKQRLERKISIKTAFMYFLHLMRGLEVVHKEGIVHRDLKPANIMFRASEELAIADFGISKRMDATTQLTQVGSLLGTPAYMSPEQISAQPADHRADLYSAGVILYEMLVGQRPFIADSFTGLAMQHLSKEPPPLPEESRAFESIYRRLLAKDPDVRYQHASEVVAALMSMVKRA